MSEATPILVALSPMFFNGASNIAGGDQVIFLENYLDGVLPTPIRIVRTLFWWDGLDPIAGHGNVSYAVDPGQSYIKESGFPVHQATEPRYLKTLAIWECAPGGSRQMDRDHIVPIVYRSGDAIVVAPELSNTGGAVSAAFLAIFFEAEGDIVVPPLSASLFNVALNMPTSNNPGICIRNLVPGPSVAATQIRVRVSSCESLTVASNISHLSAGIQGSGPNMSAAPVELTFGTQSGCSLYPRQDRWSDWTPLNIPSGANLLINASLFGATNAWSYGDGTPGSWSSQTDSWNSANMAGNVAAQPSRTHVISRVQVR